MSAISRSILALSSSKVDGLTKSKRKMSWSVESYERGGQLTGPFLKTTRLLSTNQLYRVLCSLWHNPVKTACHSSPYLQKFAIKWSGRCAILENADVDRLLWTPERQKYFLHFKQTVVLLFEKFHKLQYIYEWNSTSFIWLPKTVVLLARQLYTTNM